MGGGVNGDLRYFHPFLLFLQDQDFPIPPGLLRLPSLKQPDRLPRFLTDDQVRRLRDDLQTRLAQASFPHQRRDAALHWAAFHLMWQAGLRLGEVEGLRMEDLDLPGRKILVRQGKGNKDRTVYLTDAALEALSRYLAVRGFGATDDLFLYRGQPVHKDLIRSRIQAAGQRAGVKVYPHRLRHTCATQLLNAGCRITTIQKLLGHQRLNSTMTYARVHDQTVADDYYAAMARVEKRLDLSGSEGERARQSPTVERTRLLELVDRLVEPAVGVELRLDLVAQMRLLLEQVPMSASTVAVSD